jgi:hypothetical protein
LATDLPTSAPRELEIRFRLSIDPAFALANSDIEVVVSGTAVQTTTVVPATVFNPITVSLIGAATPVPYVHDLMQQLIAPPFVLPALRVTETRVGDIQNNDWIYFGMNNVPSQAVVFAGSQFGVSGLGEEVLPVVTATGATVANLERIEGVTGGMFRFRLTNVPSGTDRDAIVVTIDDWALTGPLLPWMPNAYDVDVYHVANNRPGFTGATFATNIYNIYDYLDMSNVARFNTRPFNKRVVEFIGDIGPGTGTEVPGADHAFRVPVTRPSVVNAAPLMVGAQLVNLRGIQEVLGGRVDRERNPITGRSFTSFGLPHATNGMVFVNISEGTAEVLIGGLPASAQHLGLINIDDSWYILVSALPSLLGYEGVVRGGFLYLYEV